MSDHPEKLADVPASKRREGEYKALLANFASFAQSFARETDRAVVIVVAARIDEMLKDLVAAKLIEPRRTKDSLVNGLPFKSRVELSYRLCLLPERLVEPLMKLGELRNRFAHKSQPMDMMDEETAVREFLRPLADVVDAELMIREQQETASLRDEFLIAASFIVSTIQEQIVNTDRLTSTYEW